MPVTLSNLVTAAAARRPAALFPAPRAPVRFNFDQGNPAPETYPINEFNAIGEKLFGDVGARIFDYVDPNVGSEEVAYGSRLLRERIAARSTGIDAVERSAENVILTSGASQAIALVAQAYVEPGDAVFVEAATFTYGRRFLEDTGARVYDVPLDQDGMDVEALAAAIADARTAGLRPKLIYCIPTFQVPTGVCLSVERRHRLVEIASREGVLVLEDDVYGELRYQGERMPSLLSLDSSGLVMQAGSFSKTLAPGLRLGWLLADREAVAACTVVRKDLGVSQYLARIVAEFMDSGAYDSHVERVREVYRAKVETAVAALREHCEPYVSYNVPQGSFFMWLRVSDEIDWAKVGERVLAEGVHCRPGERFASDESSQRYLRMAVGHVSHQTISDGIAALGRAIHQSVR